METQVLACYVVSTILQVSLVVAMFIHVQKRFVNKQYKQIQTKYIHIYYYSIIIGILCDPTSSWLQCIIESMELGAHKSYFILVAIETIFKYTIPSSVIILNIIMSFSMFQRSRRMLRNVAIGISCLTIYAVVQFFAQILCFFSDYDFCPTVENRQVVASSLMFYSIQFTFVLLPYGAMLILTLLMPKLLVVEYYEYEESEQLLKEKQNELYII